MIAFVTVLSAVRVPAVAEEFGGLDQDGSLAGASASLSAYLSGSAGSEQKLIRILTDEKEDVKHLSGIDKEYIKEELSPAALDDTVVDYPEPKTGVVCVRTVLNLRYGPSSIDEIVTQLNRRSEVQVIGRVTVNQEDWYKIDYAGREVYAMAKYILFGAQAKAYLDDFDARVRNAELPEHFEIGKIQKKIPKNITDELAFYEKEINYGISNDYPKALKAGDELGRFKVLLYLIENFKYVMDIAEANLLPELYNKASSSLDDVFAVEERLFMESGKGEDEFVTLVLQERAEKARKEAERIKEEEKANSYNLGVAVANHAAQYIGVLPYVWAGASLVNGADCSGFIGQIMAHFGLLDQDMANRHGYSSAYFRELGREVSIEEIQPGDVVCYPGHVAIYYGDGVVVHAPSPGKKVSFGNLYMKEILTVRRFT